MNKKNNSHTQHKDSKSKVLDPKGVVAFFQYVGLIAVLLSMNLGLASLSLLRNLHIKSEIKNPEPTLYQKHTYIPLKQNNANQEKLANAFFEQKVKGATTINVKPSVALNSLIAYSQSESSQSVSKSDVEVCSFRHGNSLYANETQIKIDKSEVTLPFCVSVKNTNSSKYHWNINGQISMGNCIDLSSINTPTASVSVMAGEGGQVSSCSLLVRGIN